MLRLRNTAMKTSRNFPSGDKCKKAGEAGPWAFGWYEIDTFSHLYLRLKAMDMQDVHKLLNGVATEPYCGTCGSSNLHGLAMDEHKKLCQANPLIVYPCPPCKLACESLEELEEHQEHWEKKIISKIE